MKEDTPERQKKMPQRMTTARLKTVAVRHLQRFPCSVKRLRFVLRRKIVRSVKAYDDDEAELFDAMEAVIESLNGGGLLNDERLAEALARSLHRRGKARRAIRQKLRQKGLEAPEIERALGLLEESVADPDLAAAIHYARRRRMGPFQPDEARRAARRQKDLAALGRQGFAYGIAKRVITADDPDTLLEVIQ